ncbi:MAG: type VI secretion system contractile sheath small subunit [Thermoanaerobaculia bacterium]
MSESIQHRLSRVRPPRVQITYDVETGGAITMTELPLVVGILADLSGKPAEPLPYVKKRKFVEIDRDNFNDVMASAQPRLALQVENKLNGQPGDKLNVELNFHNIGDFHPGALVKQVEALQKLYEARQRLRDLAAKLDGNDDLDGLLQEVANNTESQQKLSTETGRAGGEAGGGNG